MYGWSLEYVRDLPYFRLKKALRYGLMARGEELVQNIQVSAYPMTSKENSQAIFDEFKKMAEHGRADLSPTKETRPVQPVDDWERLRGAVQRCGWGA